MQFSYFEKGSPLLNKKLLRSWLEFSETQKPAPSFIIIYIITWLLWHNQVFSSFISTSGDIWRKTDAALSSVTDNQYIVVLLLTSLIFALRLAVNYFSFRSRAFINEANSDISNIGEDNYVANNDDVKNIMALLTKTQDKLAAAKEREKKANEEKNDIIRKMMALQQQVEELKADNQILLAENQKK